MWIQGTNFRTYYSGLEEGHGSRDTRKKKQRMDSLERYFAKKNELM